MEIELPDPIDPWERALEAAKLLAVEGLNKASFTTPAGKVIELDKRDYLKHVQWMAAQNKRKPRAIPLPKDVFIRETQ